MTAVRDLALARQRNYALLIDTCKAWGAEKDVSPWARMHRLVLAAVARAAGITFADDTGGGPDRVDVIRSFLDRITVDGSITADVLELDPTATITADHEARARDIMAHWDPQLFVAELAAEPGPKGDTGPRGPAGPPGPAVVLAGTRNFDSLGNTDSERTNAVNAYFRDGGRDTIVLPAREISTTVQLELWSWFSMQGGVGVPSREYGRCRWKYTGGEASIFRWADNRSRHSYPNDGSPRDGNVIGVEFTGNKDVIPRTADLRGKTLWYWLFHNCGGNGIKSFSIGYGNGTQYLTGVSHAQAFTDTLLDIGGSENGWFGNEHSFIDSKVLAAGKPMLRSKMDKSYIRQVMTTTRGTYVPLEIYGGHALHVKGVSFDAQDGDASAECAVRITGGDGIHLTDGKFKGMAKTGARPIIDVLGGRQIVIDNNDFIRKGAAGQIGPVNTPLVKVSAVVADGQVKVGFGNTLTGGYTGRLIAARLAQVVNIDPTLTVEIG